MPGPVASQIDDAGIRALVSRLARPSAAGGYVIERAAILAAGSDSARIEDWILDHAGRAEQPTDSSGASGGLHGARLEDARASSRPARRYVLPPGALDVVHDSSS